MKRRKNNYLTLLLLLTLISLISLVFDKETMGFYQLSALSFSSFSSLPLPAINRSTIIISILILLVIIVALVVIWRLRRIKKNSDGEEILAKTEIQEQITGKTLLTQSIDSRLAQYVRDARVAGLSNEIISQKLHEVGWPEEAIRQAL